MTPAKEVRSQARNEVIDALYAAVDDGGHDLVTLDQLMLAAGLMWRCRTCRWMHRSDDDGARTHCLNCGAARLVKIEVEFVSQAGDRRTVEMEAPVDVDPRTLEEWAARNNTPPPEWPAGLPVPVWGLVAWKEVGDGA